MHNPSPGDGTRRGTLLIPRAWTAFPFHDKTFPPFGLHACKYGRKGALSLHLGWDMRGFAQRRIWAGFAGIAVLCWVAQARGQVFTVGEKTATAGIDTDFKPTRVDLPQGYMTEAGRRDLIRNLEAEQGFAHRVLPLATTITLQANGALSPKSEEYKKLVYQKGQSAGIGDRVVVTSIELRPDRLIIDLNGGPYPRHRFLSHVQIGVGGAMSPTPNPGQTATGTRVVLVFEGGVPEVSAPEVKALLYPVVDFNVKSGALAYADTLPAPIKSAIASHEVLVGMDRRMVLAALGAPESKIRESSENGTRYEEWIYGHQPQTMRFVRFEGDTVTLMKIAELGKPMEIHDHNEMAGYVQPKPVRRVLVGDAVGARPGADPNAPMGDDNDQAASRGVPTLKKPGEVLPDAAPDAAQNGRVQYPVAKKPSIQQTEPTGPQTPPAAASPQQFVAPTP